MDTFRESFGEYIRKLREDRRLPIRKVAAELDIDPSTLSKIERGERLANKDMILKLSKIFQVSGDSLGLIYLSDKVASDLVQEGNASEILRAAEKKIEYLRSRNVEQTNIDFDKS